MPNSATDNAPHRRDSGMPGLERGRYRAREAQVEADMTHAQSLRHRAFHGADGRDADAFDEVCRHFLIEDMATDRLVCCFRVMLLPDATQIDRSYSAQFYDLSAIGRYPGPLAELGRFCIAPGLRDPDVLRLAWAALTRLVDAKDVTLLFGCTSFAGTEPGPYEDAFAVLHRQHLAPLHWRPRIKAADVVRFGACPPRLPDLRRAMQVMPPLLKSYLSLGGWVSDHAVIDHEMNTLHVFTGVETGAIPAARKRILRESAR